MLRKSVDKETLNSEADRHEVGKRLSSQQNRSKHELKEKRDHKPAYNTSMHRRLVPKRKES